MDNAREAVIEGQAQAMMFQYAIAPTGHSIVYFAGSGRRHGRGNLHRHAKHEGLQRRSHFHERVAYVPLQLRHGVRGEADGRKAAKRRRFAGVLRNPPHTTRQIMQPETYLSRTKRSSPCPCRNSSDDFKDYIKFDIGAMGEFDVAVLIEQYAGKELSKRCVRIGAADTTTRRTQKLDPTAPLGLLYVSRWSSAEQGRGVCRNLRSVARATLQEDG